METIEALRSFYARYSHDVIRRPGYPARAAYKAYLAWRQFGPFLRSRLPELDRVADVGGCFGFGLNAFLFHGRHILGHELKGDLYELDEFYLEIGQRVFPHIRFKSEDFCQVVLAAPYDITLMFDLLEHVPDPAAFLAAASLRTRVLIIKTPLESLTTNRLVAIGRRIAPLTGSDHPEGHIHFFDYPSFVRVVADAFELQAVWIVPPATFEPFEVFAPEFLYGSREAKTRRIKELVREMPFATALHRVAVRRGLIGGQAFLLLTSKKTMGIG